MHSWRSVRILAAATTLALASAAITISPAAAGNSGSATGVSSYFGMGRKDCVGTAQNTTSKIWYTVANGVLSDVYGATVDITNLQSLQYIVTDGSSWTDLQASDMTYTAAVDSTGMSCTITSTPTDSSHDYTLTTTYITDTASNTVLIKTTMTGASGLNTYVRMNSAVNGNGGGGDASSGGNMGGDTATVDGNALVSFDTNTSVAAQNATYMTPQYLSLTANAAFGAVANGYADPVDCTSNCQDPLTELENDFKLSADTSTVSNGNVVQVAQLNTTGGAWELALSLNTTQAASVSAGASAVSGDFATQQSTYESQWQTYDSSTITTAPPSSLAGLNSDQVSEASSRYYQALNTVKAAEDKTYPGALGAGLAAPWGQSVPAGQNQASNNGSPSWSQFDGGYAPYFGSYKEVFARDASQAATTLLYAGDTATAQNVATFLLTQQQLSTGQIPRNSLPNGQPAPDSGAVQIDESAFPILLAYQSGLYKNNASLYTQHIVPAADWIIANGPEGTGPNCWQVQCAIGVERWEEQHGYSPSSIAAVIAGMTAASAIATANGDTANAQHFQAAADNFQNYLPNNAVNTSPGNVADANFGSSPYYLRVAQGAPTDAGVTYSLGNGITPDQSQLNVIDPGFLELVRLGAYPASNANITNTVNIIDSGNDSDDGANVGVSLPNGVTGYHRYATGATSPDDGYGDCIADGNSVCSTTGAPWAPTGTGIGHAWPLLNGERGEYEIASGDYSAAGTQLVNMMSMAGTGGLIPEQAWISSDLEASSYGSDPATASIGFTQGRPAGSAMPLTWATAQFARLTMNLGANKNLETPSIVTGRYANGVAPILSNFSVSSPAGGGGSNGCSSSTSGGGSVTVTGSTAAGATIVAKNFNKATGAVTVQSTTAGSTGSFSVAISTVSNSTLSVSAQSNGQSALSLIGLC